MRKLAWRAINARTASSRRSGVTRPSTASIVGMLSEMLVGFACWIANIRRCVDVIG